MQLKKNVQIQDPWNRPLQRYFRKQFYEPFRLLFDKLSELEKLMIIGKSITKCHEDSPHVFRRFPLGDVFGHDLTAWDTEFKEIADFLRRWGGQTTFTLTKSAGDIVLFWTLESHLKGASKQYIED